VASASFGACNPASFHRLIVLLAVATFSATVPATANSEITIQSAAEAPVELLRPAQDEVLVSGRESIISWRALRDLPAEGIHEWEAFLSFDGGRSWPVRATPHLDIELPSARFAIPLVPSDDVRLMLRFGDERHEIGYVLPIVLRSSLPVGPSPPPSQPMPALDHGEVARPGVQAVVLWVEGDGGGRQAMTRSACWRRPVATRPRPDGGPFGTMLSSPDRRPLEHANAAIFPERTRRQGRDRPPVRNTGHFLPLLLLLCRRNE